MTSKEYTEKIARLKEIEATVRNPESGLDKIDGLIDETKKIVEECHAYTRKLEEKIASLDEAIG